MVFLWVVGRKGGRNAFCTHSMNAANLRDAAYGAANSARSPGIPERSWAPRGGGVSLTSLHSGVPHCTILACVRHVDGPTGRARRGKKGSGWRSEQRGQLQMLLFTLFSHLEEQRAGGCQQLSGTQRSPGSANPRAGAGRVPFRDKEHLCSDAGSASSLCVEAGGGRTSGPSTCHCSQTSAGGRRRQPRLRLSLDAPDGDRLMASALIPAFELQMRGAGSPVVSCDAPLVRAAYCSL